MTLTADDLQPNHYAGRYEYKCGGMWLTFDHLVLSSRGLDAWVEARWTDKAPKPKMLHVGRMDVMGSRTVSAICRSIKEGVKVDADWQDIVGSCVLDVVHDHLEGAEPVSLTGQADRARRPPWVLHPLIGATGSSSLIAPGGSTKSFIALAAALSVAQNHGKYLGMTPRQSGPVAYLDWEADADTHEARIAALCAGHQTMLPRDGDIFYFAETTPLYRVAPALAKRIAQEGAVLAIVDSVMLARGGDAFGTESTTQFYSALRQLGVPCLLIDHKSREAMRKGWKGAYGSVVNDNTARLQWEITLVEPRGPNRVVMKLEQTKRNNVGQMEALAFEAIFDNDEHHHLTSARFAPLDLSTVEVFTGDSGHFHDQVLAELRFAGREGMLVSELAQRFGKSGGQIRNAMTRLGNQVDFRKEGRENRWWAVGEDDQEEMESVF